MLIDGVASLSIKSLTHEASAVTTVLGLTPTSSAEIGDPVGRIRTGADGKPAMRERTHSIWVIDAPTADDKPVFSGVRHLLHLLDGKRAALESLQPNYFLEIRWSGFSDREQAGFLVPSDILLAMGELGLDFHGAVYLTPGRSDEPDELAEDTGVIEIIDSGESD